MYTFLISLKENRFVDDAGTAQDANASRNEAFLQERHISSITWPDLKCMVEIKKGIYELLF